jgi:FkbM family methyltransferase
MAESPKTVFDLIRRYRKRWSPALIFDVGAHFGESALAYAEAYPAAEIHCFEPTPKSHARLAKTVAGRKNVHAHNLALGRETATLALRERHDSTMNRLLPADQASDGTIDVPVRPGAEILREIGARTIDFLKIDTEGHDLDVLLGFQPVLGQVDFIQVEAAMNRYNRTHVAFASLVELMSAEGFHLFYIFEQTMEWKRGGRAALRRCNPVFISGRLVDLDGIS